MDNPTALKKALELNEKLCAIRLDFRSPPVCGANPCEQCKAVAAALKRAYADGMRAGHPYERLAEVPRILAEADQLEGK